MRCGPQNCSSPQNAWVYRSSIVSHRTEDRRVLNMTHQTKQQPLNLVTLPLLNTQADYAASLTSSLTPDYLTIVFATWLDRVCPFLGFILLDPHGTLMQSSPKAQKLCQALQTEDASVSQEVSPVGVNAPLPPKVTKVAQRLIENRRQFPDHPIRLLQDESLFGEKARISIQAEWIETDAGEPVGVVVTLEDRQAIAYQRALFDAQRGRLTHRELDVWELSLWGFSYAQIAQELFISLNTMKRHMKNIRGKRSLVEGEESNGVMG